MTAIRFTFVYAALTAALLWSGCAPSHAGRTVGKGVLQAEANLGGPFVKNLGPPVPIPNLPVGARYGLTDRIDVSSHLNLLPIFAGGFMALDAGVTWGLIKHDKKNGWNLATGTGLILFTDLQDQARISPVVDMAGGYTFDPITVFTGFETALDYWGGSAITNLFTGIEVETGRLILSAAGVWFDPAFDGSTSPVEYVSADYRGAFGFLLGAKIRFHPGCFKCEEKRCDEN